LLLAAALIQGRLRPPPDQNPARVLPDLRAAEVTAVQIRHGDQLDLIRAERTNSVWRLTKPVNHAAQGSGVESLLSALERLTPALYLSAHERRSHPHAAEEEGLAQPQAAISLQQGGRTYQIDIGTNTPPGDQLYVQVAGDAGVYIVDAAFLKLLPATRDDWRDRGLVDLKAITFDHVAVTNGAKVLELQRDPLLGQWQITNPRIQARADAARLETMFLDLEATRAAQFVWDGPKAILDAYGLQPPELEIALARGTNPVVLLQFGRSPTNNPHVVFARRAGTEAIVTVPTNGLAAWRDSVTAFREPFLITPPCDPTRIEVRADENFALQRQGTNGWRTTPQNVSADASAVRDLVAVFTNSRILEYRDAVPAIDLPKFGLTPPCASYLLHASGIAPGATNANLLDIHFGFTNDHKVFVNRSDETTVYAISLADFQRLPRSAFQLHARRLWEFTPEEVDRIVIRQGAKERQIVHSGPLPLGWSLAPGSPGTVEPFPVNETIKELGRLTVTNWVAHGEASRGRFGLNPAICQITVQLKNGEKPAFELGIPPGSGSVYAAVPQAGEPWVFEFPAWLVPWVDRALSLPP